MEELAQNLRKNGYFFKLNFDGSFQRADRGATLNAWFVGRQYKVGEKVVHTAVWGDWRTGEEHRWQSSQPATPEEAAEFEAALASAKKAESEERTRTQREVAEKCEAAFARAVDRGTTPYLERKRLVGLLGAKIDPEKTDTLWVPARDGQGKLWGFQRIMADGSKFFVGGMKIKGCFHTIGALPEARETYEGRIYICEGYATAASVFQATGTITICAFNAGNLAEVGRTLRGAYPRAQLVFCADDDRFTTRPDGSPFNPGLEKARAAATECGAVVVCPVFPPTDSKPTDFNDLHTLTSLDEVRNQLVGGFKPTSPEPETDEPEASDSEAGAGDMDDVEPREASHGASHWLLNLAELRALPPPMKDGKPKKVPDQAIADAMARAIGPGVIQDDGNLFAFTGTHWKMLEHADLNQIRQGIQRLAGGKATANQIESIFKLFMIHVPTSPVDLFMPNPYCANFLNGTLHIVKDSSYKYALDFRPHRREDYLTHVIPMRLDLNSTARNPEFEAMLERIFGEDSDKDEKIRAVRQMYGAMICPVFPHLFLLHGPMGSGKSSLIIPATRLVHEDNICRVEPHEFMGFNMETMVGKLVNVVTDIRINRPIDDANIKKIEDRVPMRIDRKFQRAVYAPLPAVHVFGANGIPDTQDGASGAHERRWTFIEMKKFQAKGEYNKNFCHWVFEQSPEGILNFAIEGLKDLLSHGGHYVNPASGKRTMRHWQLVSDPVGMFLEDIREGEVWDQNTQVKVASEGRIERHKIWLAFHQWMEVTGQFWKGCGRNRFYEEVRKRGIVEKKIDGIRYFEGLDLGPGAEGNY